MTSRHTKNYIDLATKDKVLLLDYIDLYKPVDWDRAARLLFSGKISGSSLKNYYFHTSTKNFNKGRWTINEEKALINGKKMINGREVYRVPFRSSSNCNAHFAILKKNTANKYGIMLANVTCEDIKRFILFKEQELDEKHKKIEAEKKRKRELEGEEDNDDDLF